MIIETTPLTVRYRGADRPALAEVPFTLGRGEMVAIAGPNGSGKTTLLRAVAGVTPVEQGRVTIQGRPLAEWTPRALAREVAVVAQREEAVFPLTVRETVTLGRYAHLGPIGAPGANDTKVVDDAMRRTDVLALADRRTDTLSGGEWQRVRVARALAQEPRALLLDEPTASLDIRHEMEVLELTRRLCDDGLGIMLVTHHLNLAARFADRIILLHRGSVAVHGTPADVLRPDLLSSVFEWPVTVAAWDGPPQIVPLRPGH